LQSATQCVDTLKHGILSYSIISNLAGSKKSCANNSQKQSKTVSHPLLPKNKQALLWNTQQKIPASEKIKAPLCRILFYVNLMKTHGPKKLEKLSRVQYTFCPGEMLPKPKEEEPIALASTFGSTSSGHSKSLRVLTSVNQWIQVTSIEILLSAERPGTCPRACRVWDSLASTRE
jgi:hypothetical protein